MKTEEMSFQVSLEHCQGLNILTGVGSSFHQPGTVNENVLESDFVPLCVPKCDCILKISLLDKETLT